jgi:uncharacterized membrane protein
MVLSRNHSLSFVGFVLLASACADDIAIQRPERVGQLNQAGAQEPDAESVPETVDAGTEEADAEAPEVDAGVESADAGPETADAGDDEDKGAGLPCEIEGLLKMRCQGCHNANAKNGVPLMTHQHLMAPSKVDANVAVWKRAIERMASSERPMPPMGKGQPITEEELAMFEAWVEQGMPAERCEKE